MKINFDFKLNKENGIMIPYYFYWTYNDIESKLKGYIPTLNPEVKFYLTSGNAT